MKLLDKIKNAIFEDDEIVEDEIKEEQKKAEKTDVEVVKKIDIEKTIPKKIELPEMQFNVENAEETPKREHRRTPVIFDEDDFIVEEEKMAAKEKPSFEEYEKKRLYGGYKDDKPKEKFKPSPVISPVYGYVGVSPILENPRKKDIASYNEFYSQEKKDIVTLEEIRKKAYGIEIKSQDEDDDLGLLYDMKEEKQPAISKITLGDAEEYFEDLGLEYNVDYKDSAKEKSTTRVVKINEVDEDPAPSFNENTGKIELPKLDDINLDDQRNNNIKNEDELEITKEQIRPRSAAEIKKIKKITDLNLETDKDEEEPDEKNLYDLIDMMYESKE